MLLYFILGILFALLGISLLDNISSILSSWTQYIIHIFAFKIYKIKKQIQELGLEEGQEEASKIPMGFHTDLIGTEIYTEEQEQEEEQEE